MRIFLFIPLLLLWITPIHAAVNLAVSKQSGPAVLEQASQLARQLGSGLGTSVDVVELADAGEVESWLNRYATAELALVENAYAAGKPGQFIVIGPVGRELTLIGRQGIAGNLPQRLATVLTGGSARQAESIVKPAATSERVAKVPLKAPSTAVNPGPSKSAEEDRYFVTYVYREKFGGDPDPERLAYWTAQLQSGVLTKQQFQQQLCRQGAALCPSDK